MSLCRKYILRKAISKVNNMKKMKLSQNHFYQKVIKGTLSKKQNNRYIRIFCAGKLSPQKVSLLKMSPIIIARKL